MWLMVMIDLPVVSTEEKRQYTRFSKYLLSIIYPIRSSITPTQEHIEKVLNYCKVHIDETKRISSEFTRTGTIYKLDDNYVDLFSSANSLTQQGDYWFIDLTFNNIASTDWRLLFTSGAGNDGNSYVGVMEAQLIADVVE